MFGVGTPANLNPLSAEYGRRDSQCVADPNTPTPGQMEGLAERRRRASRAEFPSFPHEYPCTVLPHSSPRFLVLRDSQGQRWKAIDVPSGGLDSAALASTCLSPVGARRRSSTSDFHALPRANRTSSKRRKRNSYCASNHSSGHCSRKIVPTQKMRPALSASAFVSLSVRLQPGDVVESAEAG
jgi:hypothetical protein